MTAGSDRPRLHGVLITFRRPRELRRTLDRLAEQDRPLDRLVVVDNASDEETSGQVAEAAAGATYLPLAENGGPAGGIAAGMRAVMGGDADDDDWIVLLDDDDPPRFQHILAEIERLARHMRARDGRTAGVGLRGARFDWRTGRARRIDDERLHGAVSVDYLAGNGFPFYLVAAVRRLGPFLPEMFFGFDDLEYGLRLRRAGHTLHADGDLWRQARAGRGRLGRDDRPSRSLGAPDWRRYYELRNLIFILRRFGRPGTAVRVAAAAGVGKPLANLPLQPRVAARHLALNLRAVRDGWLGRLGRTVEPVPGERRAAKVARLRALGHE
jgi:glycosyltransferase involved in cell wall biosynthesis